jgi:hypothetical protein
MHGNCHGIIIIIYYYQRMPLIQHSLSSQSLQFLLRAEEFYERCQKFNFSESQEPPSPQQLDQVKLSMTLLRAKNRIHALTAGP